MRKKPNHESGQALIELIIFLPLMLTLYYLISGFANAINGSINQQKITRAYLYYRVQNNSTIPKPDGSNSFMGWSRFGMFFVGWKEKFENGTSPVMPCYRVSVPLKEAAKDVCNEEYSDESSQFIRVGTVYGLCGATYGRVNERVISIPDDLGQNFALVSDIGSCLISR